MIENYFLYCFIAITAINCFYYLIYSKFTFSKHKTSSDTSVEPVSVIVYTKNEAEILTNFLNQFEKQSHSNFEVILVNNASSDETRDIAEEFEKNHDYFKLVNVENNEAFWGSKKYALTLGIKKASFDKLLFTTPHIKFESQDWVSSNASLINSEKQILVGYHKFSKKKTFTSGFTRFSELISNLQNYGTYAITKPYLANETNFGYTKSLFFENNGFSSHMSIFEGSEDLFLKYNGTSKNIILATAEENTVILPPINSFSQWHGYKKIKFQTRKHFSFLNKLNLTLFSLSQLLFIIFGIIGCLLFPSISLFIAISIRYLIAGIIIIKTAYKLKDLEMSYLFPFWEILHSFFQIPIFIRSLSSK